MRLGIGSILFVMSTCSAGAATLSLNLAADLYEGGANFEVLAGDEVVGSGVAASAEGEEFSFQVADEVSRVSIRFTNDAAAPKDENGRRPAGLDRNLVIVSARLGDDEWVGADFSGEGAVPRGSRLVLATNTEVELVILDAASQPEEEKQAAIPEITPPPADESQEGAIADCNLSIDVTGYSNGVVNVTLQQQDALAPVLKSDNCSLQVTGYSSTSGPAAVNEQVALDRARAVIDYLLAQGGKFSAQEALSGGETEKFGPALKDNRRVVVDLQ